MTGLHLSPRHRFSLFVLLAALCIMVAPNGITRAQSDQPPPPSTATPLLPQAGTTIYLPIVRGGGGSTVPGQPVINSFAADQATIAPGGEATLRWNVSGATTISIDQGIGNVTGDHVVVKPAATTTYTLVATSGNLQSKATATVTVDASQGKLGIFQEPDKKTGTPDIAIDAAGGSHMAYAYHVPVAENPDLIYAYCPPPAASCTDQNRWQRLNLSGPVDQVQISLTADGHPRILARGDSSKGGYKNYYYGECDSNCTSDTSWNFALVTDSYTNGVGDITGYYLPKRYFALDPQGRPRFVFYNGDYPSDPDRYGGYYAQCDANCADSQNWSVTRFTHERPENYRYELIDNPALAFTSKGEPRVVAQLYPLDNSDTENGIYYLGCDSGCEDDANWDRVKIAERGGGPYPAWDIAIDPNDHPRVAFYKEDVLEGDSGKRLHYLSCDNDCFNGGWNTLNFGLPRQAGDGADIELDVQGRPRIAYLDGSDNLRYSFCNGGCENGANWQHGVVETGNDLDTEYPIARPITCDAGLWDTYAPSLALDATGNPHITYNGSYKARCLYQDPTDPTKPPESSFSEIWHSSRLVTFPQS